MFIEPKGAHLVETDRWKEEFLLEVEGNAIPRKVLVDDNNYKIWGFHFFNQDMRSTEFAADMDKLLKTASPAVSYTTPVTSADLPMVAEEPGKYE